MVCRIMRTVIRSLTTRATIKDEVEIMQTGIVKWFNNEKGFGFIQHAGKDFFVHYKEIRKEGYKTLKEGESVKFTEAQSDKGRVAKDVYPNDLV